MRELRKETETAWYDDRRRKIPIIRNERTPKGDGNYISINKNKKKGVIKR